MVDSFYDAAVSGADPVGERPGFKAMMDPIAGNGVRVIIVESPDRFARDLAVQIAGHDYLKGLGVALVPTSAPDLRQSDQLHAASGASPHRSLSRSGKRHQ
jgi:DNA invertase Pin-like site-specific DNA recombinase